MPSNEQTDKPMPIYLQLRELIRTKIEEKEYMPGMMIPSENEMAKMYGVNRLTVRNAIDALVKEGLLKRVQGKGIYVIGEKMERDLETLGGFTQTMLGLKVQPSVKVRVKSLRVAGEKYSRIFGIKPDDEMYYVKRICYADHEPISLEEIMIPKYIVPKLEGIDLTVFSLSEVYQFYGIHLKRAWQTLKLAKLKPQEASMLGIDPDMAVLLFECTSYDENERVIEFARTYTRGDKCNFSIHFHI
ncbi:UNVERIFIED_ORG: GntR family transcriptional regulator [Heyndrickxia coagulans]